MEEEERDYYGENQKNTSHRSNHSDINNMEIEGTDGVKLVLTSVAVQVFFNTKYPKKYTFIDCILFHYC